MSLSVLISGLSVSLIFGLSFLFTKNSLDHVPAYTFLSYRFLVAAIGVTILYAARVIRLSRKPYWRLWRVVIFQPILYFTLETNGLRFTTSSEAGMLIAMIPIAVMLISPYFLRERVRWWQYGFAGLSFTGVALIIGFGELLGGALLGKLMLLGAVFSAAMYNVASRRLSREFRPEEITFFMMLTGFVFFTLLSLGTGQYELDLNPTVLVGAIYLGLFSSIVAFFLVNFMLSKVSPTVSSLFANLTMVISVLAGSFVRREVVRPVQILGMVLIVVSLFGNAWFKQREWKTTGS